MSEPSVFPDSQSADAWVIFDDIISGWSVALHLVWSEGRSTIAELRVHPEDTANADYDQPHVGHDSPIPYGGLTASLIRHNVNLRTLHNKAEEAIRSSPLPEDVLKALDVPPVPGGSKRARIRDDRFYARIAAEYVRAASEQPRNVYGAMSKRLSYKPSYCKDLVKESVKRGLLLRTRGRVGGNLTSEAIETLRVEAQAMAPVATDASANGAVLKKEG